MKSALIVSNTEKSTLYFLKVLVENGYEEIVTAKNCGEARRLLIDGDFNLYIINTPLLDEFGEHFALSTATGGTGQVILVVQEELLDEIASEVENMGVITIAKPISKEVFWSVLKLVDATSFKMTALVNENRKLLQKIEDMRLVGKAKCVLARDRGMSEEEAHKYIEKKAMDLRMTRKEIARWVIRNES